MKTSKYNIFLEQDDDAVLAFNSLTGALVKMDSENYLNFINLANEGISPEINTNEMQDFMKQLKLGGFLIEDSFDEMESLKRKYFKVKESKSFLKLEIAPTNNCNFSCKYCFNPNRRDNDMTEEVQNALVEFVRKKAEKTKVLSVLWTGGEPSLAPDIIIRLSKKFMEIAKDADISYDAAIFSNGYNLNYEMANSLKDCGVSMAQIVLDGPREVHDKRRTLVTGGRTHDVIIKNIKEISKVLPVLLRVNLDFSNSDMKYITQLMDELKEYDIPKYVAIEFAQIVSYTSSCTEFVKKHGFNRKVYAEKLAELIPVVIKEERLFSFDLTPQYGAAPCTSNSSFGISPEGDVYRCFLLIGDKRECIGNLLNTQSFYDRNENFVKWDTWNPFERKECIDCDILPICMGGDACPFPDVAIDGYVRDGIRCSPLKFKKEELIRLVSKQRMCLNAI